MLHWCGVARDGQIIGESVLDSSALPSKYAIQELAARLMAKRPTPGFEYATGEESLRAIKLHIHDANDSTVWGLQVVLDATYPESRAKSVLSNMVKWSQPHRATNLWRTGDPAAVRKNMNEKLKAVLTQANTKEGPTAATHVLAGVDEATALMHHNIELLLERQEKLEMLSRNVEDLSQASKFFHTQAVRAKRFHMWQEAKWGMALGTAATIVGAILVAPVML